MTADTELVFTDKLTADIFDFMGNDKSILRAMLVSTGKSDLGDRGQQEGRINFLMENRHGTPFEHASMTFYVEAPIFVFREFHRHRVGWSYNEVSGRYTKLEPKFYVPPSTRALVQVGKPGAYDFVPGDELQYSETKQAILHSSRVAWTEYERLLAIGVAKEVARMVLPVNIYTAMYATCNPRSLMHFLSLRTKADPEVATYPSFPMWEINNVADQMELTLAKHFPITYRAWVKNGRVAP